MDNQTQTPAAPPAPPQSGGGQDSTVLNAADGARLVGIIQKMNASNAPSTDIDRVVTLYKQHYGKPATPAPLPGQDQIQYQPDVQQPAIPQANVPQFGLTAQQAATLDHRSAYSKAQQDQANLNAQHRENTYQSLAQKALNSAVQGQLGQYARPSSTSAKPVLPGGVQVPDVTEKFPDLVNQYMDPEAGYATATKINEANDQTGQLSRDITHQMALNTPAARTQIRKNQMLLDRGPNPDNPGRILANADAIEKGDLDYDIRTGQVVRPEGFVPSLVHSFEKRNKDMADADVYMNGTRDQILDRLEQNFAKHDPDEPVGVPKDWWAGIGSTVGDQGPVTLEGVLAGAMGTTAGGAVGNPELGPVLAAAVTTPEFMARSYKNSLEKVFMRKRQEGLTPEQALDEAAPVATRSSALDGAQAAAMSVLATKLGFTPDENAATTTLENGKKINWAVPQGTAPTSYLDAATKLLKKVPSFAKETAVESGAMGTLGAAVQGLKNINEGNPQNEGTGEAFTSMAAFTAVMAALGKGLGTVVNSAKDFNALRRGAAQAPQSYIDEALGHALNAGVLTPQEVIEARSQITDQKAADAALPGLDEATQEKIQKLITQRDNQQKLMNNPALEKYKDEFKSNIAGFNAQIDELKGAKEPDQLIKKAQDIIGQDKIPGMAGVIAKEVSSDPEKLQGHLREIAEQSYDPGTTAATKKAYGGLVDIAQELYPEDAIPEVQHFHSYTPPEEPEESHTPVSKTIQTDPKFRTIDYGDYADGGVPETPQARASIAKDIEAGDVKIGNTGETFNEFKPRVLDPFKKALEEEKANTAIVTSSSVLKAFKVWDDMGRPDIHDLTPEQTKDFAQRYNDETITPAEQVSFDKVQGDPASGQIHVFRHGETASNELGTFRTDEDNLTKEGIREASMAAVNLKDHLQGEPVPKIITSDLPRTIHTSNIVHDIVNDKVPDPRATEYDPARYPEYALKQAEDAYDRAKLQHDDAPFAVTDEDLQKLKDQITNLKTTADAVPKQKTDGVDVRQQAENGPSVGVGDTEYSEPAATGGGSDQQRADAGGGATNATGGKTAAKDEATDEKKNGNAGTSAKVKETIESAPNPVTGIRNAVTEFLMEKHGLEPWEKVAAREWGPVWNAAKEKMRNGFDIQGLIEKLEADPGLGLTDENAALLTYYQARKEAELEDHANTIIRAHADKDMKARDEARIAYASTLGQLEQLYDVTKETGREAARGFNARKMLVDRHYTLANMVIRKMAAKDGAELTPEESEKVKQQFEDIKAKNDAYEKRIAELEEENKRLKAEKTVEEAKKGGSKKAKTHDQYTEERKKILDDIREKLRKARGEASAAVVPYAKELAQITPDVFKLVKSLVEEGIDKLPDLIGHVHEALSDVIDGITRKDVVDMLAGEHNEQKEPSEMQKKLKDLQMQSKLINKYVELKLKEEKGAKDKKEPVEYSQEVKDLQKLIKDYQDQNPPEKALREPRKPVSEETKLKQYKTGLQKQIAELGVRLRDQDFSEKPKPNPILLDKEAQHLKAELQRAKDVYEFQIKKDAYKNRPTWQKISEGFVKVERAMKLSSPITLGKLSAAAFTRLTTTPIEEGVGAAASLFLPEDFKKKALGEANWNGKALATGYRQAITTGMKDAYQNLKNQRSDLEGVFGKQNELPNGAIEYLGQLHGAIKAPIKRFAFERSLQKQLVNAIKYGVDVRDPVVMTATLNRAYKASQRAIFMQDNMVSDFWKNVSSGIESNKRWPVGGKIVAQTAKWLIPFVKIPSNIIGEVGAGVGGTPYAAIRFAMAMKKGLENVSEDEADMIIRNFKKGTVGIGAMLLGYFNPKAFGGFYQQGQQKKADQPGWMGARVFGVNIPGWALESPIFQLMQLGATTRKVKDTYIKKTHETEGFWKGAGTSLLGISDEEPLISNPQQIWKILTDEKERGYYAGELAKSTIDPAILNNIATWTDPADKRAFYDQLTHSDNMRKPTTVLQHVETGIPGLRENVPLKKAKKTWHNPNAKSE